MNAVAWQGTAGRGRAATWNGPRLMAGGNRLPSPEVTLRRPDPGGPPARDGDGAADPPPSRAGFRIPPRGGMSPVLASPSVGHGARFPTQVGNAGEATDHGESGFAAPARRGPGTGGGPSPIPYPSGGFVRAAKTGRVPPKQAEPRPYDRSPR